MITMLKVDRVAVRRFLLESQLLSIHTVSDKTESAEKTTLAMIQKLECIQIDPVSAVAPNQHLVLAARLPNYKHEYLNQCLVNGQTFEYMANAACIIPIEDFPIFKPIRERLFTQIQPSLVELKSVADAVLERLIVEGPLPSRAFKSERIIHGYWDNKQPSTKETSHALNLLHDIGLIRVVNRVGTERFFDLTSKTVPEQLRQTAETIGHSAAKQSLIDKYIRAYRVIDPRDSRFGWQKMTASDRKKEVEHRVNRGTLIPIQIEGVQRQYYIMAEDLDRLQEISRTSKGEKSQDTDIIRFLPPLDNLLWRRERLQDLFDFIYKWEIYTPQIKRKFGYYAMPILCGDQLIGRIDPRLDRKNSKLTVKLLQIEPGVKITKALRKNLRQSIEAFATMYDANEIIIEQTDPLKMSI